MRPSCQGRDSVPDDEIAVSEPHQNLAVRYHQNELDWVELIRRSRGRGRWSCRRLWPASRGTIRHVELESLVQSWPPTTANGSSRTPRPLAVERLFSNARKFGLALSQPTLALS